MCQSNTKGSCCRYLKKSSTAYFHLTLLPMTHQAISNNLFFFMTVNTIIHPSLLRKFYKWSDYGFSHFCYSPMTNPAINPGNPCVSPVRKEGMVFYSVYPFPWYLPFFSNISL